MEDKPAEIDLNLRDLHYYTGTERYHKLLGVNITYGIDYIIKNGYSWFVTDALVSIRMKKNLKEQEFLSVKLIINEDKTAVVNIEDGDLNVLYTQEYKYTNCKVNLKLFYTDDVLLLAGEY